MNYKVSKNQIDKLILRQLDIMFDVKDISWTHPYEWSDYEGEYEDPNRIEFYFGNYGDQNTVFRWYDKDYWGDSESVSEKRYRQNSPILEIEEPYLSQLNGLFGKKWYEPMKKWFYDNFEIRVNKITEEI